jgi:two-component system, CAI-1 autoinducer sensor kinase/phosphatase CqsS
MALNLHSVDQTVAAWTRGLRELMREPLKPIAHPSVWRIRWLGFFIIVGNPLFYFLWTQAVAQMTDSLTARLLLSLTGLLILVETKKIASGVFFWKWFCVFILFVQLPLFFIYMAALNDFNSIWLGSCVAMVMIYHQATDWRIASAGTLTAIFFVTLAGLIDLVNLESSKNLLIFTTIFTFSWATALVLSASAANLSKINTLNTAFNLGVMAHELRTPISSIGILGTILKNKHANSKDEELLVLSEKLEKLVGVINTHIDNQIINSKIINIKQTQETIQIKKIVDDLLLVFPYKNANEQAIISYTSADDFTFKGSAVLFTQVFNNLIRNALKALAAKELPEPAKRIEIISYISHGAFGKKTACIDVTDNGIGIETTHIRQVLEPFFSTNDALGHGLGLSFCKKVVEASNGRLSIKSIFGHSTTLTIELPYTAPL